MLHDNAQYSQQFLSALLLLISALVVAASPPQQGNLEGTWISQTADERQTLIIRADNTFSITVHSDDGEQYFSGSWMKLPGKIQFIANDSYAISVFSLSWRGPNQMVLSGHGISRTYIRQGAPREDVPVPQPQPRQTEGNEYAVLVLADTWVAERQGNRIELFLDIDNRFELTVTDGRNSQKIEGRWDFADGNLLLNPDDSPAETYPVRFSGDDSWTGVFNGNEVTFTRQNEAAESDSSNRLGSLIGSDRRNPDAFTGVWQTTDSQPDITYYIRPDNTYTVEVILGEQSMVRNGQWKKVGEGELRIIIEGEQAQRVTYTLSGDQLILTSEGTSITLKRKESE